MDKSLSKLSGDSLGSRKIGMRIMIGVLAGPMRNQPAGNSAPKTIGLAVREPDMTSAEKEKKDMEFLQLN